VLAAVEGHVKARRKVLVHCWGGGGRTGLVQAAWLARAQGLSAADAAAAVTAHAKAAGVPRRVDVAALEAFLQKAAPAAAT
jgi:protein-tyrosine phosphatase